MEIGEIKERIASECELLGGGLPYDGGSFQAEDWQGLADEMRDIARHAASCANVLAGYAGYAQRRANKGD